MADIEAAVNKNRTELFLKNKPMNKMMKCLKPELRISRDLAAVHYIDIWVTKRHYCY